MLLKSDLAYGQEKFEYQSHHQQSFPIKNHIPGLNDKDVSLQQKSKKKIKN